MHEASALLSRRERQIMDIIYQIGEAAAAQVMEQLPDPPSYSAVRTFLRILEEKGHLIHRESSGKYIYRPTHPKGKAGEAALQRVVQTFFDGSLEKAVAALFSPDDAKLSREEWKRVRSLIDNAKKEGR
jgi:predicted transcriptional regulator